MVEEIKHATIFTCHLADARRLALHLDHCQSARCRHLFSCVSNPRRVKRKNNNNKPCLPRQTVSLHWFSLPEIKKKTKRKRWRVCQVQIATCKRAELPVKWLGPNWWRDQAQFSATMGSSRCTSICNASAFYQSNMESNCGELLSLQLSAIRMCSAFSASPLAAAVSQPAWPRTPELESWSQNSFSLPCLSELLFCFLDKFRATRNVSN